MIKSKGVFDLDHHSMSNKKKEFQIVRPLVNLHFDQALQITPLLDDLQASAQSSLAAELSLYPGDIISAALQIASTKMHWSAHVAKFTQQTESLLQAGTYSLTKAKEGTTVFLSARNGKGFVENAKRLNGAKLIKAANLAAIAVNICHVVSGIDTARKVERISKDIHFLREARRVTQLSRLEAIYRYAKELLSGPVGEHEQHRLHDLTMTLFELRAEWRRELVLKLENVENDEAGWFGFTFQQYRQHNLDKIKQTTISQIKTEIELMDFSIILQMALSFAAGRHEAFLHVSLPDEMRDWECVGKLLLEKSGYIKESSIKLGLTVAPVLNQFDSIVSRFHQIAGPNTSINSTAKKVSRKKTRSSPTKKGLTSKKPHLQTNPAALKVVKKMRVKSKQLSSK